MQEEEYVQCMARCGISFCHLWIVFLIDLFMMATSYILWNWFEAFLPQYCYHPVRSWFEVWFVMCKHQYMIFSLYLRIRTITSNVF